MPEIGQTILHCKIIAPRSVFALTAVAMLLVCCQKEPDWSLPIEFGDSRDKVRWILGDYRVGGGLPDYEYPDVESYPNSGMTIKYRDDQVQVITVGGGKPDEKSIPYQSPIVNGITIYDRLPQLMAKLGEPTMVVGNQYKWRRPPYMIEVFIGAFDWQPKGEILWITLTRAVG